MNDFTKIITVSSLAFTVALALPGCGESSNPTQSDNHSPDDGHDHAEGGHEDHDQAEGEHDEHEDDDHGEMTSLGTVSIAGTTLTVSISSNIDPFSEVHVDIEVESGAIPTAVRLWVGDEAGTGALKSKADGHGNHFHGQTEAPASLTDASLWVEVESASGERFLESMPLQ